jgi:hypothetical protein
MKNGLCPAFRINLVSQTYRAVITTTAAVTSATNIVKIVLRSRLKLVISKNYT